MNIGLIHVIILVKEVVHIVLLVIVFILMF